MEETQLSGIDLLCSSVLASIMNPFVTCSYKVYTRGVTVEASSFEWSLAFVARSPFVECNPGRHCFEAYNIAPTLSTELTVRVWSQVSEDN